MRKQSTPVELLMESIRSEKTRHSLRKTSGPPIKPMGKKLSWPFVQSLTGFCSAISAVETSRCKLEDWQASPLPNKRVIRPDPDLVSSLLNFSDDDESGDDEADNASNEDKNADIRKNWHKQCKYALYYTNWMQSSEEKTRKLFSNCHRTVKHA